MPEVPTYPARYRAVVYSGRVEGQPGEERRIPDDQIFTASQIEASRWMNERCDRTGAAGAVLVLDERAVEYRISKADFEALRARNKEEQE